MPILEKESGLRCGVDFKVGYSPERINPGDKVHTVDKIIKVVSGQDAETLETVAQVYDGRRRRDSPRLQHQGRRGGQGHREHPARPQHRPDERAGHDLRPHGHLDADVLAAAGTKWNFLKFTPGLVGGHCIGVDPYYLTYKAEEIGYHPQVILAGRRINDGMGKYVAEKTVKKLIQADKAVKGSRVLVLGLTFKENVPISATARWSRFCRNSRSTRSRPWCTTPLPLPRRPRPSTGSL